MYSNVGKKIKTVAVVLCGIGITAYIIYGLVLTRINVGLGILLIIIGPLLSWLATLALYGFGQLVDNSDKIVNKIAELPSLKPDEPSGESNQNASNDNIIQLSGISINKHCPANTCAVCGKSGETLYGANINGDYYNVCSSCYDKCNEKKLIR